MDIHFILIFLFSLITGIIWIGIYCRAFFISKMIVKLDDIHFVETMPWPRLSIIVPARNEANSLPSAVNTLLSLDYPNLEIILINDRSTDATEEIINQIAQQDKRVVPVHIRELPKGWLGKVNALNQGTQIATGEWLLFTDADVHFEKDTLKKTISFSEENKLDHLAVIPRPTAGNSFLVKIIFMAMLVIGLSFFPVTKGQDNTSDKGFGVGAFNLVKKKFYLRSKGFEWLRMEPLDDIGLGFLIKDAGGKSLTAFGMNNINSVWYASFTELMAGVEKNIFSIFRFSWLMFFAIILLQFALIIGPFAVFWLSSPILFLWPLLIYLIMTIISINFALFIKQPLWVAFLAPLGCILFIFVMCRAAFLFQVRGGIYWRGHFYSSKELYMNQRVQM